MKETQVIFEIDAEFFEIINVLKKHYKVKSDAELVRILINEKTQQPNTNRTEAKADATQNKKRPPN